MYTATRNIIIVPSTVGEVNRYQELYGTEDLRACRVGKGRMEKSTLMNVGHKCVCGKETKREGRTGKEREEIEDRKCKERADKKEGQKEKREVRKARDKKWIIMVLQVLL